MVQFRLPKNSRIKKGKVHNSPNDGNFKRLTYIGLIQIKMIIQD